MSTPSETNVAVISERQKQQYNLIAKMDTTIETMANILASVRELLAVHEQRHEDAEKANQAMIEALEARRQESNTDRDNMKKELIDKIDKLEEDMSKDIEKLSEDTSKLLKWLYVLAGIGLVISALFGYPILLP